MSDDHQTSDSHFDVTDDRFDEPIHLPDPAPLPPGAEPDRWKWPRRLVAFVALVAAVVFCVKAVQRAPSPGGALNEATDPAVVRQIPDPGGHVLHQTSVGAQLLPGYDGRLTIDGTSIPEDQMDGAAPPGSPAYDPRYGVRPNNKEKVFFTPGAGKVIEEYGTGEVHITLRFWRIADGEKTARRISWAFFVN